MNIAVYGLGRIGRLFFRLCHGSKTKNFTIKLLADRMPLPMAMNLIKYDSTHGKISEDFALTSGSDIKYIQCSTPEELPYKDLGIDYVIDASGKGISRVELFPENKTLFAFLQNFRKELGTNLLIFER